MERCKAIHDGCDIRNALSRQGCVVLPDIVPAEELDHLRDEYDALFARSAGWMIGDFFDMLSRDDTASAWLLPQLAWPSRHAPWMAQTEMRHRSMAWAKILLGARAELVWEFAINKPPHVGAVTPWHQDEASFTLRTPHAMALSCWIPLQDVDEQSGCMIYVPGSHQGRLLSHRSVDNDPRIHGLEAVLDKTPEGVSVPLRAGSAVIHHSRVLHASDASRSGVPWRAITLEFAVRHDAGMLRRDFPWNQDKKTARDEREWRAMPLLSRLRRSLRRSRVRLGL